MAASLSFDQAPPISVPLRFFLTAPLFGVAGGLLLAFTGGSLFDSRWQPAALALTHLMTLGFMLLTMCGALLQILPVASGANVWRAHGVGWIGHVGLVAGTLLLVGGFLSGAPLLFRLGGPLLGATLAIYVVAVGVGLVLSSARGPTIVALRLAIVGLVITAGLGVALAAGFGWPLGLPLQTLTSAHAAWGLLGWSLALVAGVAYLVVPMFQLTPPYKPGFAYCWPLALVALCAGWTAVAFIAPGSALESVVGWSLSGLVTAFAVVTLSLQRKRRRKVADSVFLFWRTGMASLIGASLLGAVRLTLDPGELAGRMDFLLGILMIGGVFTALINGMLYKIVPFIAWLHLQGVLAVPPNMHQMIPERMMRGQFRLYLSALGLLVAAVVVPPLTLPAGLAFAASCLWLELNLARAMRLYVRFKQGRIDSMQVAALGR
jgi:hypothetical protein